jgi:hypothetical protein
MTDEIHLYDIRERSYPNKRGDHFRSLQIFQCPICNAVTNRCIMGGWPGYGLRAVCPNAAEEWHHSLEDKTSLQNPLHPKTYREELANEITSLLKECAPLIQNDLVGQPDFDQKSSVTNTRSWRQSAEDKKFFDELKIKADIWASKNRPLLDKLEQLSKEVKKKEP